MPPDTTKPRFSLSHWVKTHKKRAAVFGIGGVALLAGIVAAALMLLLPTEQPVPEEPAPAPQTATPAPPPPKYYSPITGLQVDDQAQTTAPVTAIMIENSPDARPQSGIKDSGVVYEAIAEGGITRFLLIYQQEKPALIGPVRSLRMYYVDWLAPYHASVAHVGGSAASLAEIRNGSYRDIDQFFNAGSYWRASDRYAPHNVYTNFERLDALNAAKGFTTSEPRPLARKDSSAAEQPTATQINVTISGPTYNSSYTYDRESNTYPRSMAGAPHLDREAGQVAPRVVVVLKTPMTLVREDGWRQQYQTTGSGQAVVFQDGLVSEVTWHKPDRASQLSFTDSEGKPFELARGQTWISAVPTGTGGVTWQ